MAEIAPAGGGPNRLFVVLALGLAGLLILGVIALGGFFVIQNLTRAPAVSPTRIAQITTPTRAPSPTEPPTATSVPTEAATPTLVFAALTPVATATSAATPTPTDAPSQLPKSGMGDDMLLLGGGILLVAIIFVARRARFAGGA